MATQIKKSTKAAKSTMQVKDLKSKKTVKGGAIDSYLFFKKG